MKNQEIDDFLTVNPEWFQFDDDKKWKVLNTKIETNIRIYNEKGRAIDQNLCLPENLRCMFVVLIFDNVFRHEEGIRNSELVWKVLL